MLISVDLGKAKLVAYQREWDVNSCRSWVIVAKKRPHIYSLLKVVETCTCSRSFRVYLLKDLPLWDPRVVSRLVTVFPLIIFHARRNVSLSFNSAMKGIVGIVTVLKESSFFFSVT